MQRSVLESLGWLQGCFLKPETTLSVFSQIECVFTLQGNEYLIVASQSCDLATNQEQIIELSIAHPLSHGKFQKAYSHNRHPRILHSKASTANDDMAIDLCLLAHEKISIDKALLIEQKPDNSIVFSQQSHREYVDWLAARYKRPALPTTFDRLIQQADKKSKRKKIAKQANDYLLGIYVQIYPNTEIEEGQVYSVNLLGIIETADYRKDALQSLKKYADLMNEAGMEVNEPNVFMEKEISLARFRQYQRINFDYLSYEANFLLPPDVTS